MIIHRLLSRLVIVFALGFVMTTREATAESGSTSATENEALIHRVLDLINDRQLDAAFELYAEDYIYHGPGGAELRGRDEIRGLWVAFLTGYPDLHSTVDELIVQGDRIVMRWTIYGTHTGDFFGVPASNNPLVLQITEIFRVENGQLAEAWDNWDRLSMAQQMGGTPEIWQAK